MCLNSFLLLIVEHAANWGWVITVLHNKTRRTRQTVVVRPRPRHLFSLRASAVIGSYVTVDLHLIIFIRVFSCIKCANLIFSELLYTISTRLSLRLVPKVSSTQTITLKQGVATSNRKGHAVAFPIAMCEDQGVNFGFSGGMAEMLMVVHWQALYVAITKVVKTVAIDKKETWGLCRGSFYCSLD